MALLIKIVRMVGGGVKKLRDVIYDDPLDVQTT